MVYMRESYKRIVSKDKAKADYLLACAEIEYSVALGVETVSL
jgi:hypothetical protein